MRCPNCDSEMNEGDPCPECEHTDTSDCECPACDEDGFQTT